MFETPPDVTALYTPSPARAMNTVVFASGGGGNLQTALSLATNRPDLLSVQSVVTDRTGIAAIDIAQSHDIPVITRDFRQIDHLRTGKDGAKRYAETAESLHDEILRELLALEERVVSGIDLIILSYRRLIRGALLRHFDGHIINQHPGDLSVRSCDAPGNRTFTGCDPVYKALSDGARSTRTCCILVREGMDTGEILCSGPQVPYEGPLPVTRESAWRQELLQKEASDKPCLQFVLEAIATGRLGLNNTLVHDDGCRVVHLDRQALPYAGKELHTSLPLL